MQEFQNEEYYKLKELQNLLNYFEKAYPVIAKNIKKFKIESIKDKCYLSWIAGMNFHEKEDIGFIKNLLQDLLFKNIYNSLNINEFSEKALLFIYFSLGLITITNYANKKRDFYKEYMQIISKGAVILDKIKFDRFINGYRYWDISTLQKYFFSKSYILNGNEKNFYKEEMPNDEISSRIIN